MIGAVRRVSFAALCACLWRSAALRGGAARGVIVAILRPARQARQHAQQASSRASSETELHSHFLLAKTSVLDTVTMIISADPMTDPASTSYGAGVVGGCPTTIEYNDILNLGSRRNAAARARRQRGGGVGASVEMLSDGAPGQFDVPNVPDVSNGRALRVLASMGVVFFLLRVRGRPAWLAVLFHALSCL